jgi:hypothetical protein
MNRLTSRDISDLSGLTLDRISKLNSEGWFHASHQPINGTARLYTRDEAAALIILAAMTKIGFTIRSASYLVSALMVDIRKGRDVLTYGVGETKLSIDVRDIYSRIDARMRRVTS